MIDTGSISDGYHTFDELYEHRCILWIALCAAVAHDPQYQYRQTWRSRLHSDGSMYEGWFVLGMTNEKGEQMTYHLPVRKWDSCSFAQTLDRCPPFDGHTSADVLKRISELI